MEKKNSDISMEYVIKNIGKAEDEKDNTVVLTLEPTVKPKIPGKPMKIMTELSGLAGAEPEDVKKIQELGEGFLGELMNMSQQWQITITKEQLKALNKTVFDKVTVTVQ